MIRAWRKWCEEEMAPWNHQSYDDYARAPRSLRQVPYQVLAHLKAPADFGQWTRSMGPGSE
jgi:hypothetical protein